MYSIQKIFVFLITLFTTCVVWAEEDPSPNFKEDYLSGDWGGARTDLYKKGVDFSIVHKSDFLSNLSGGIKSGSVWEGYTSISMNADLDKLIGWDSATLFIQYHSGLGGKFNSNYVGGFVGEDNVEVATNTAQFYQAWIQKDYFNHQLSLLAGLYPIDSEFFVTESSSVFVQPPYGMSNDVAQAGVNGPPVYPLGALGLRIKYVHPYTSTYVQLALTDGVPGDPNDPHGTHIKLGHGEGSLSIIEFGYHLPHEEEFNKKLGLHKLAVGFWNYSAKFDDLTDTDVSGSPIKRRNRGIYILGEGSLFREDKDSEQGLNLFLRLGQANEDINQANWTGSLGANYQGFFNSRDEDVLGLAVTVNHTGDKFKQLNDSSTAETDIELTYRAKINGYLAIQPTLQFIKNPGMVKSINDSKIIGIRFEINV